MGLFDMFLSVEKRIQKEQRNLTNRDKQPEDRESAARWLADNGTPKALVGLLTRFDMNLDNQLSDRDEKEFVYALLANIGEPVLRPLERHLKKCRQFALPIRLYTELRGEEAAIEQVFEALQYEYDKGNAFKPQKKTHLLVWLAEKRHPRAAEVASPFLGDFDEGVRCGAAEVILAQEDGACRDALERALANPKEESNRLRHRLAESFRARRYSVDDPEALAAVLPDGFAMRDGRVVSA